MLNTKIKSPKQSTSETQPSPKQPSPKLTTKTSKHWNNTSLPSKHPPTQMSTQSPPKRQSKWRPKHHLNLTQKPPKCRPKWLTQTLICTTNPNPYLKLQGRTKREERFGDPTQNHEGKLREKRDSEIKRDWGRRKDEEVQREREREREGE